jgi:hypothetical protein
LAVTLVFGSAASLAAAQAPDSRQVYEARLTSKKPAHQAALWQAIHYRDPANAEGKPYSVQQIEFQLPPGSVIDTSVPPQCGASDLDFQMSGEAACPAESKVGFGNLSLDFGTSTGLTPRVVENAVTFFNNEGELILFTESTNTGAPVRNVGRVRIEGATLISSVPPLPGSPPPDNFAAVKDVFNSLAKIPGRGEEGPAYIRTPETCPRRQRHRDRGGRGGPRRSGAWTITATFTYRDGVAQTETAETPCRRKPRR